jgi:hypothetical protein
MKNKLLHPLWTHIPALGALIFIIVYTIAMGPLPATAPIHWDFSGNIDGYGSPYLGFWITVGLSILFIGISIIFDELWARQEKKKTFNWFSLFDELTVGFLVGVQTGYLQFLKNGGPFSFPWVLIIIIAGALLIAAKALDLWRPYRPNPNIVAFGDTAERVKEVAEKIQNNASFVHWESQNPWWVSLLALGLPLIMCVVAVVSWFALWWVALIIIVTTLPMVFMYGGVQTTVTREEITVGFGILNSKVLRLKTDEIEKVELTEFSPIADFGGYGIRINKEMSAYYMRGNKGVKFTTLNGKKYLIGSDKPEELYAVAQAVAGRDGGKA